MITINLLPEELRKVESSFSKITDSFKLDKETIRNIAIAAILLLIILHVILFFTGSRSGIAFKTLSKKYNELVPGKKEYEALKAGLDVVNRKAKAIEVLMANRFSWAKKLNDLSDSLTPGIWLTDLSYDEKETEVVVQVKTASIVAGAKKEIMKSETKRLVQRYLSISGFASSMGEQGTALIGKFIKSMKENPSFFTDFSEITLESIKSDKVLDQEVMNFNIRCFFKK
jgi:hypothetical protein